VGIQGVGICSQNGIDRGAGIPHEGRTVITSNSCAGVSGGLILGTAETPGEGIEWVDAVLNPKPKAAGAAGPVRAAHIGRKRRVSLIQAFSRTNRVLNGTKPYGNVLDFRQQQDAVDAAIALFSGEKTGEQAREI
jgi:hypothetical protein